MKHTVWFLASIILCSPLYADNLLEYNEHGLLNFNELAEKDMGFIQEPPDFQELFNLGNQAIKEGNVDNAIKYFEQSIQQNDCSPQVHFNLGYAYETKGDASKAIEAYKDAVLLKLDYTKAHARLALLLQQQGNLDEAITHYQHAISLDPTLINESLTTARLLCEKERFEESLPYFKQAFEARSGDIQLKFEYANNLSTSGHNDQALKLYQELLQTRPNDGSILYNTAFTLKKLGRITEALPLYERTLTANPNHAEAHFSLGLAHLSTGDFKKGWEGYEWRWQRNGQMKPREFPKPRWDGSPLNGKTILIHAEQGLGDTFQFIRYAQLLKEQHQCSILFASQGPLATFVSQCCPYIDRTCTLSSIPLSFDVHIPLLSLPLLFQSDEKTIPTTIPYIFPEESLVAHWKEKLSGDTNFKVGICWQGNSRYSTPTLRATVAAKSLSMHKFTPLSAVQGVTLYSLQKETGTDQLKKISPNFDLKLFEDIDTQHGRFMDTAAIIKNLDLVITVDTSIAHLAAAVGTPVWIILPEPADWRWMINRSNTPWYPKNVRLFRQPKPGDWTSVIEMVMNELKKLVTGQVPNVLLPQTNPPVTIKRNTLTPKLDFMQQIIREKIESFKDLDSNDYDACIREIKIVYRLHKFLKHVEHAYGETA